jgi:hypothetical protein
MTGTAPTPGSQIHALHTGLTLATGDTTGSVVLLRGQVFTVTDALLAANRDRLGQCFLDDLSDAAQINRWGRVMLSAGPSPADLTPWEPGGPEHAEAREEARKAAWGLSTQHERAEALAAVQARYGAAPLTSKTILNVRGDDER